MKFDGDSALLVLLIALGLIPVAGDLTQGRRVGGLTTLAMLLVSICTVALMRRTLVLMRARALRRRLLSVERWSP